MATSTDATTNFNLYTTETLGASAEAGSMVSLEAASAVSSTALSSPQIGTTTTKIEYDNSNRMLSEVLLNPLRPELLAIMDLRTLVNEDFTWEGDNYLQGYTKFYDYMVSRSSVRTSDAATVSSLVTGMQNNYSEEFSEAYEQYETSVAAAVSELELLKLTYMLKNYMILGTNFRDFLEVYDWQGVVEAELPMEEIEGYYLGSSPTVWLPYVLGANASGTPPSSGLLLASTIQQLAFIHAFGSPATIFSLALQGSYSVPDFDTDNVGAYKFLSEIGSDDPSMHIRKYNIAQKGHQSDIAFGNTADGNFSFLNADRVTRIVNGQSDNNSRYVSDHHPYYQVFSSIISSNLNPSYVLKHCNLSAGAYDTVLWDILQRRAGATSTTAILPADKSLFLELAGWDPFLQSAKDGSFLYEDCMLQTQFFPDLTMFKDGIMADAFDEEQSYVDKHDVEYTGNTGNTVSISGIKKTVNEAFGSESGLLNFSDYTAVAENLESSSKELGTALARLHRTGNHSNFNPTEASHHSNVAPDGVFQNYPQGAFDAGSILVATCKTFRERFASSFEKYYLWYGFQQSDNTITNPRSYSAIDEATTHAQFSQPAASHIKKFASLMAYGMINSDNTQDTDGRARGLNFAKRVVGAFVKDYHSGHLTFVDEQEEVVDFEADDTGQFVETSYWVHKNKSPLSGTPVSLRGVKTNLWSLLATPKGVRTTEKESGAAYYEVSDLSTNTPNHVVTTDILDLYGGPLAFYADNKNDSFSSQPMAGWLQWAPVYTPGESMTNSPKFFTKSILNTKSATVQNTRAMEEVGEVPDEPLHKVLNALQNTAAILAQAGTGAHTMNFGLSPEGTWAEACNMWKYSWHYADNSIRTGSPDDSQGMVPLLANLWAAEMIEMVMLTMRYILEKRGHKISPATASDLCFPLYAFNAPYHDDKGWCDYFEDQLEQTGCVDNEFPFHQCYLDRAASDTDNPTGIDFSRWVPTMNAIQKNFCRDDGTLMSGMKLEKLMGHIIDQMAILMKTHYPFFHIAYVQQWTTGHGRYWPLLGNYSDMQEADTLRARVAHDSTSGDEKPEYTHRGEPMRPRVLFPYYCDKYNIADSAVPGSSIMAALNRIIYTHEKRNSICSSDGGEAYNAGDIKYNEQTMMAWVGGFSATFGGNDMTQIVSDGTLVADGDSDYVTTDALYGYGDGYDSWDTEADKAWITDYPDSWISYAADLVNYWGSGGYLEGSGTFPNMDYVLRYLMQDNRGLDPASDPETPTTYSYNPRVSLIYYSMWAAVSGNPDLFGFGDDDGGRGAAISNGSYDYSIKPGQKSPNNITTTTCPHDFWATWFVGATPHIIDYMTGCSYEKYLGTEFNGITLSINQGAGNHLWAMDFDDDSVAHRHSPLAEVMCNYYSSEDLKDEIWSAGECYVVSDHGNLLGYSPGINRPDNGFIDMDYWALGARTGQTTNVFGRDSGGTDTQPRFNASFQGFLYEINGAMIPLLEGMIMSAQDRYFKAPAFNILEEYGERIKNYSGTAIEAFAGKGSSRNLEPVIDYVRDLASANVAGQDVLQNLTEQQIALKYLSFYNQKGDPKNGLIPMKDTIDDNLQKAITLMFDQNALRDRKGLKTLVFGIPAGGVEEFDASSTTLSLGSTDQFMAYHHGRTQAQMMMVLLQGYNFEFPQVVLEPMLIPIVPNLFLIRESFDDLDWDAIGTDLSTLRNHLKFLRVEISVQEGQDQSAQVTVNDQIELDTIANLYGDGLTNQIQHAAFKIMESYLLEQYYKITTGVVINEDTFPSTSEDIGLGINAYAANLSEALSAEFASYNSTVSSAVSQVMNSLVSSTQNYSNIASDFTTSLETTEYSDLADEILDSVTNAGSSRIYSAEKMKETIIKAKRFDRIIYVHFHPDDFAVRWKTPAGDCMGASYTEASAGLDYRGHEGVYGGKTASSSADVIGYTAYEDLEILSGGTVSDLITDDTAWILTADGAETIEESVSIRDGLTADSINYSYWGGVTSTGIKFRERSGEESINFFRATVSLLDLSLRRGDT